MSNVLEIPFLQLSNTLGSRLLELQHMQPSFALDRQFSVVDNFDIVRVEDLFAKYHSFLTVGGIDCHIFYSLGDQKICALQKSTQRCDSNQIPCDGFTVLVRIKLNILYNCCNSMVMSDWVLIRFKHWRRWKVTSFNSTQSLTNM